MRRGWLSGSISVSPPRAITKCRPFGVIVPLRRWCGVRAALPRGSSFGLLSVRTTFCSNFDGWPYGGIGTPGARRQGPLVSGSAAALVSAVVAPVVTAPARTMPCPSNARRSSRPLPATGSSGGDALPSLRCLRMLMILSPLADGRRLSHRSIQALTQMDAAILLRCKAALNRDDPRTPERAGVMSSALCEEAMARTKQNPLNKKAEAAHANAGGMPEFVPTDEQRD